jgi:hypothetical protein
MKITAKLKPGPDGCKVEVSKGKCDKSCNVDITLPVQIECTWPEDSPECLDIVQKCEKDYSGTLMEMMDKEIVTSLIKQCKEINKEV